MTFVIIKQQKIIDFCGYPPNFGDRSEGNCIPASRSMAASALWIDVRFIEWDQQED